MKLFSTPRPRGFAFYDSVGKLSVDLTVKTPSSRDIHLGLEGRRRLVDLLSECFEKLMRELHEHHGTTGLIMRPEQITLPVGPHMGEIKIYLRANTEANRMKMKRLMRELVGLPTAAFFRGALDPNTRQHWLAEWSVRQTEVDVVVPDDSSYTEICRQLAADPPTEDNVLRHELPVGDLYGSLELLERVGLAPFTT